MKPSLNNKLEVKLSCNYIIFDVKNYFLILKKKKNQLHVDFPFFPSLEQVKI